MLFVLGPEYLKCDKCGERLVRQGPLPTRLPDHPRNGEYLRGSVAFAQCDNGDCSNAGTEIQWALIPRSRMGVQKRHLGASTYDGRRVLPDPGARNATRRPPGDSGEGYYGDERRPSEPDGERKIDRKKDRRPRL